MKKMLLLVAMFGAMLVNLHAADSQLDTSIKKMLDQSGLKYTIDNDLDFLLRFQDGNSVFINSNTSKYGKSIIRNVWTIVRSDVTVSNDLLIKLMLENRLYKLGSFCLYQRKNGRYNINFIVRVPADANWNMLDAAISMCSDISIPEN